MRRTILYILSLLLSITLWANDTIPIPLSISVYRFLPQDNSTGSTPDPTDPNQFRASLVGNTLLIQTQKEAVSYVVIHETQSERAGEDYFYSTSYSSVSCPVVRPGFYTIRIGYWTTDFTGHLWVKRILLTDGNGHLLDYSLERMNELPAGFYILRLETNIGTTTVKFYKPL